MIGFFKKKSASIKSYSEDNTYFLNDDIAKFYDYHNENTLTLSYQKAYQIGKDMYLIQWQDGRRRLILPLKIAEKEPIVFTPWDQR